MSGPVSEFDYEGRHLCVHVLPTVGSFRVQVYEGDEPVGPAYMINQLTVLDAEQNGRYEGTIEHAVEAAKTHILTGNIRLPPRR
jgi:hypothetical protein